MLLGDLLKSGELTAARVGEQYVDGPVLLGDSRVEAVDVREVCDVAPDSGGFPTDFDQRGVESLLPAARDNTCAPSRANRLAVASPIPLLPPVTTAVSRQAVP